MPCATSCCSFASAPDGGSGSDSAHVTEKHYGCYKAGILFALAIILLLLVGCVPVFVLTANNNVILLILLVTLVLIGLTTFAYFRWQRARALAMRRTYEQQKFALTRVHQHHQQLPQPTAASTPKGAAAPMRAADGNGTAGDVYGAYGQNGAPKQAETMGPTPPTTAGIKLDAATDHEGLAPSRTTKSPPRYSFI